jgi:hypothetical protein
MPGDVLVAVATMQQSGTSPLMRDPQNSQTLGPSCLLYHGEGTPITRQLFR